MRNHRAGRVLGDDGAERIVRTFHARFGSIKCGGTTTARQAAEYVLREGKHAGEEDENKADVEAAAGDKEAMLADARRIRQTTRITHGPTGERILATQIIELPAESTKEQRQACAQAFGLAAGRGRASNRPAASLSSRPDKRELHTILAINKSRY